MPYGPPKPGRNTCKVSGHTTHTLDNEVRHGQILQVQIQVVGNPDGKLPSQRLKANSFTFGIDGENTVGQVKAKLHNEAEVEDEAVLTAAICIIQRAASNGRSEP